jgi:hypothetical protein
VEVDPWEERKVTILRQIRVASEQELKDRIMAAMDYINPHPVFPPGPISSTRPPYMIRNSRTLK